LSALSSPFYKGLRPLLFSLPPELAHGLGIAALRWAEPFRGLWSGFFSFSHPRLRVRLGTGNRTLSFENPVGLAAGLDKDGEALHSFEALGFGFMEVGTVTPRPQPGNPKPRLYRFPDEGALVNQMGFNNRGAIPLAHRLASGSRLAVPLGINIGKNKDTSNAEAVNDYLSCLETLYSRASFFVVNVSSPNTPGLRDLQNPADLAHLLRTLREKSEALAEERGGQRPLLFVKISPDELSPETLGETALKAGFDGVVAVNTTKDRRGLPFDASREGGASGRPLKKRATEVIRRLRKAMGDRLSIVGVGGIFNADDAYEKILAGASLVEVYTGFVYEGPAMVQNILKGLVKRLTKDKCASLADAVGKE